MNEMTIIPPGQAEIPSPVAPYVEVNPTAVLLDDKLWSRFLTEITKELDEFVPDLETAKGRKAIAALAAKYSRTKTAIDDAGLALTKDWRDRTKVVNAARSIVTTQLDELRDRARKPLTDWENAEAERLRRCDEVIRQLEGGGIVAMGETSTAVADRLEIIRQVVVDQEQFQELFERATAAKTNAIAALEVAVVRIEKEEADRAELERLRAEAAERQRVEEERAAREREAAEAEERRRRQEEEARLAEEQRQRDIAAAAERARAEAVEAEQRRAREEAERVEREHQAEIARLNREKEEAEAETRQLAAEEEARQKQLAADREHMSRILGEIKADVMGLSAVADAIAAGQPVTEEIVKAIVLAIARREIRHASIRF